ncbi:MAG TPA: hypothetical protein GXZ67_06875 [Clostridiaceae bacterium]|nr:hypothetical protein [Clostridiaceae bacterium]
MKRLLTLSLCTLLVGGVLAGCGIREKIEKKAGEAIGEKIVEGLAGEGVDVDIKDGEVKIKGEDGEEFSFGGSEWPDSGAVENIPKYKDGTVDSVIQANDAVQISIIDADQDYFEDYIEDIKDEFDNEPYESESSDSISYSGKNDDDVSVLFIYSADDETCFITVSEPQDD